MNTKLRFFLAPLLVGAITFSCDKKELEEVSPAEVLNSESTSAATSTGIIYQEDVEGTNPFSTAYLKEIGTPHALTYVSNPVFEGSKSARFEIRESDPLVKNGKRSEVTIIHGTELPGKDMWYSFAAYFPSEGFAYDDTQEMINQWYQDGSPATGLRINKDRFYLETGNEMDNRKKIDLGQVTKDTWHQFVFHFIHSHGTDGLIEVWHNGNKILTHKGGNMYNMDRMPKWKIGLYKSSFKYGTSKVDKRVAYYDNIRVGNHLATLADMIPGKGTTTVEPAPTEPEVTEPAPTEPEVTEPAPTEPEVTEPAPTEPVSKNPKKGKPVLNNKGQNKKR